MILKNFVFCLILNASLFSQELQVKIDSIETLLQVKKLNLQYFQNEVGRLDKNLKNLKHEKAISDLSLGKIDPIFVDIILPGAAIWIGIPIAGSRVGLKNINKIKVFPKFYEDTEYILAEHNGKLGWLSSLFYSYDSLPSNFKSLHPKN